MLQKIINVLLTNNKLHFTVGGFLTFISLYTFIAIFPIPFVHHISFLLGIAFTIGLIIVINCLWHSLLRNDDRFVIIEKAEGMFELWLNLSNGYFKCLLKDSSRERILNRMQACINAERRACLIGYETPECTSIELYSHTGSLRATIQKNSVDVPEVTTIQ